MNFEPKLFKLSNGITVIIDPMDIETTAMTVRVNAGSRNESPKEYGVAHFLEHMLMAGTNTKGRETFTDLHNIIKGGGGRFNASTSHGRTRFHGRILAENFPVLADVLADCVTNSKLGASDIERERGVITQEYKKYKDDSDNQFWEIAYKKMFEKSGLEHDILGTLETISALGRNDFDDFINRNYVGENIIIGISGKVDDVPGTVAMMEKLFAKIPSGTAADFAKTKLSPTVYYDTREDRQQTRIIIGFRDNVSLGKENEYWDLCQSGFQSALGERLHDEVREKMGLVYQIYQSGIGDEFAGANLLCTSLSPEKLEEAVSTMARVCKEIMTTKPVTEQELARWKTIRKLARADFLESSVGRRDELIGHFALYKELYDPAEYSAMRDKITVSDIAEYNKDFFNSQLSIIAQGPETSLDLEKTWKDNF